MAREYYYVIPVSKGGTNSRIVMFALLIAIVAMLLLLYGLGLYFSKQCASISGCKDCWSEMNLTQKNNAYVNLTSCACGRARYNNYGDPEINNGIVNAYRIVTGNSGTVQDICEGKLPMLSIED